MRYKDLLNTNDILNLLTNKLNFTLKQMGRSVFFLCPFHSDKTQYKKISLEEAVEEISQMGYFSLSVLQEKKKQEQKFKDKKFYLLSLITDIYQHNLLTQPGREVLNYLHNERQIDKIMIDRFGLGCSITNPEGKTVAFVARKVGKVLPGEGKYKYLPSYQYYQKSSLLYNYLAVKKSRVEECYLVEGFFDVISLTKLGVENCLALLGTNLSEEQLKLLTELKQRIILFLDSDKAGQEATISVATKLLLREVDCEVIKNDYSGDPDEICQQQDPESIKTILQSRENPYSFILNYYFVK
ncbi:13440_t:CDS:2 [Entrophospora sp. SA101]|nr:10462_t:CDS:2 [Entrophospora sp. SA101]CAJ0908508.1 13440_t:CDS:2 [Entrophospora sp. SA101]